MNFFIGIGAPKSGTTWFHRALEKSALYVSSNRKEVTYFSSATKFARGEEWYNAQFDWEKARKVGPDALVGEISVSYCYAPETTAERIHAYNPDTKIILFVRTPKARSISHLTWLKQLETLPAEMPMDEALTHNPEIIGANDYVGIAQAFLKYFSSDAILVIRYETIFEAPLKAVEEFFFWFGVSHGNLNAVQTSKIGKTINPRMRMLERFRIKVYKFLTRRRWFALIGFLKSSGVNEIYRSLNDTGKRAQVDIGAVDFQDYDEQIKALRALGIRVV